MNPPDTFHNVCGKFASNNQEKTISSKLKTCYKHYFGCKAGYQYKKWAPHIGASPCVIQGIPFCCTNGMV